jgi:hypothetical protein
MSRNLLKIPDLDRPTEGAPRTLLYELLEDRNIYCVGHSINDHFCKRKTTFIIKQPFWAIDGRNFSFKMHPIGDELLG